MDKVYCKNCRHKASCGLWCENPLVLAVEKKKLEDEFGATSGNKYSGVQKDYVKVSVRTWKVNKEGECKIYKKKWYKFWIK